MPLLLIRIAKALIWFERNLHFVFATGWLGDIRGIIPVLSFLSVNWLPPLWNTLKSVIKQARHYSMQNKTLSLSPIDNICLSTIFIYSLFVFRNQRNLHLQLKVQVCSVWIVVCVWGNIKLEVAHDFKRKFRSNFVFPSNPTTHSHSLRLLFMLHVICCFYIFFKIMMKPTLETL